MSKTIACVAMWALMAAATFGQDVSKSEVLLSAGKSDKVTISVPGCNPNWTVSVVSKGDSVLTVSPMSVTGKEKANFTIKADKDAFSSQAIVRVRIEDELCLSNPIDVDIDVYVVMDEKGVAKFFGKDIKARQKTLKNEIKGAQKAFDAEVKSIIAMAKAGELAESVDGETIYPYDTAFQLIMLALFAAFITMFTAYRSYLGGIASDGRAKLSLYGFLPLLFALAPLNFTHGGCGLWDNARFAGFALLVSGLLGLVNSVKKARKQLGAALSLAAVFSFSPFFMVDLSSTIPDPTASTAGQTTSLDEQVRIIQAASTNATRLQGQEVDGVDVFGARTDNGRIAMLGRSAPLTPVDVTASSDGVPDGGGWATVVISDANGFWLAFLPDAGAPAILSPGTYTLTATTENGTDTSAVVIRSSLD